MPDPKGQKLFVNVSPSEARRRLKGFGHGVRKVQSAGRNQAVIIHTATGRHLGTLEAKFADVGFSGTKSDLSEPIENLRNLGPTSGAWLRDVGITTIAELERIGPVEAFRLVKEKQSAASLNLLWALTAGLRDLDSRELTDETKETLRKAAGYD
jgi:DNA transformation protein and related proteins